MDNSYQFDRVGSRLRALRRDTTVPWLSGAVPEDINETNRYLHFRPKRANSNIERHELCSENHR